MRHLARKIASLLLAALLALACVPVAAQTSADGKLFAAALKGTTIYEKPDAASKVLLKAEAGAMFVLGKSPDAAWAYVKDIRRQVVGYVKAADLTALAVPKEGWMEADAVSLCRDAALYAEPKTARTLGVLCRGTRVNLMGEIKGYYAVWVGTSKKVFAGYIKKQDPILARGQVVNSYSNKTVKSAPDGLSVLAGPDEASYPTVGMLKEGASVGFLKETGSYTQILFTDVKGFRNTGFVKSANLFYPFVGKTPVSSATSADGKFRLDLYMSEGPYSAGKNIDCYATVTYLGKGNRVSFWGPGYLIGIVAIGSTPEELVLPDDAYQYTIVSQNPMRVDFLKKTLKEQDGYMIQAWFNYSLAPTGDRNWMMLTASATITVQ